MAPIETTRCDLAVWFDSPASLAAFGDRMSSKRDVRGGVPLLAGTLGGRSVVAFTSEPEGPALERAASSVATAHRPSHWIAAGLTPEPGATDWRTTVVRTFDALGLPSPALVESPSEPGAPAEAWGESWRKAKPARKAGQVVGALWRRPKKILGLVNTARQRFEQRERLAEEIVRQLATLEN